MSGMEEQISPEQGEKLPLVTGSPTNPQPVVTVQPAATATEPVFKDHPVMIPDGKGGMVQTQLRYKNGLLMWIAVGLTCLVAGSFLVPCLGLVPLCIKAFKDVEHINPVDGSVVGYYNRGHEVGLK